MDESGARNDSGSPPQPCPGGGVDLISALPDDLLLQVLERLGSVAAAARSGLVSRRWRDLWTSLPKVTVALHDVPFGSLLAALRSATRPGVCHYYLDIRVPGQDDRVASSSVSSLLHAAALLSPVELLFTLPQDLQVSGFGAELPSFRRATTIELRAGDLYVYGRGGLPSLERLAFSGCCVYLAAWITRCPRLRVLSVNSTPVGMGSITICSASQQELVVDNRNTWTCCVDVQAPVLKQLTLAFCAHGDLRVSVLVKDACPVNCLCDDPKDWRAQTISLAVEEVEIEGVKGEDHEFDFLKVIFRCAPMLKRVGVRLSDGVTPSVDWCATINKFFMAYPSVQCILDLCSGKSDDC
ncbi:hypothetical protein ACQ4PT_000168 [Festuca glaucescens]